MHALGHADLLFLPTVSNMTGDGIIGSFYSFLLYRHKEALGKADTAVFTLLAEPLTLLTTEETHCELTHSFVGPKVSCTC